jgi:transposase
VEYWVRRFEAKGLAGLIEGQRLGRPRRLSDAQLREVDGALRQTPRDLGLTGTLWDGKTLSAWIKQRFQIHLRVRQCQRLFRQRGFRLRKPRPVIAHADLERQKTHKKTPGVKYRPHG